MNYVRNGRKVSVLNWSFRAKKKWFDKEKIEFAVHYTNNYPDV